MPDTRLYAPLPQETWEYMEPSIVGTIREATIGRKIANVKGPAGFDKEMFTHMTWTEVGDASVDYVFDLDRSLDLGKVSENNVRVPVIYKGFKIPWRLWLQMRNDKLGFDTATIESATYKVGIGEDSVVIQGFAPDGSTYVTSGFYQGAGNTEATSEVTSTAGNSVLKFALVNAAFAADNVFPPYDYALAAANYAEIVSSFYSTPAVMELDVLKRMLGGELYHSSAFSANTGLYLAKTGSHFDIMLGQDVTVKLKVEDEFEPVKMAVFEALAPRIFNSNALCTITGL